MVSDISFEFLCINSVHRLDLEFIFTYIYLRFDPANEGVIRTDEFRFVMSNLPVKLSNAEIEEMIATADADADGKITFEEFRRMMGIY